MAVFYGAKGQVLRRDTQACYPFQSFAFAYTRPSKNDSTTIRAIWNGLNNISGQTK